LVVRSSIAARIAVAPFDYYATCPHCNARVKVRSYAASPEIEDVFDAVFEWMNQDGARDVAERRRAALAAED
jgi:alkylhydroperoxidase family enzyme